MNKTKIFFIGMSLLLLATFIITFQRYYTTNKAIKTKEKQTSLQEEKDNAVSKNDIKQSPSNNNLSKSPNAISEEELLRSQRNAILIDLRNGRSHQEAHIKGSILLNRLPKDYDKTKMIVLIVDEKVTPAITQAALNAFSKKSKVKIYSGSMRSFDEKGGNVIMQNDINKMTDLAKVNFINYKDAKDLIEKNKDLTIVDVRRVGNFQKSHIEGAMNIPYSEIELRYTELPVFSHNILVYGANREQSFLAGALLSDLGVFDVKTLDGGYEDYQKTKTEETDEIQDKDLEQERKKDDKQNKDENK